MKGHSESRREEPYDGAKRFDEEAAQRILRRAAEEQARRENEEVSSFTLEELEEIATEAGISPEAVRAAALEHEAASERVTSAVPVTEGEDTGGWLAALKRRMPASWSPALKNVVLIGVGVGLFGLLLSVVGVGPVVFTLSAVILVLVVLLMLVGLGLV